MDSTNQELDDLDVERAQIQAELESLRLFDGSGVSPAGTTFSLQQLQSEISAQEMSHSNHFAQGDTAYTELSDMAQLVQTSDNQISLLQQQVDSAKTDLGTAITSRTNAQGQIGPTFQAAFQSNQGSLQSVSSGGDVSETIKTEATNSIALAENRLATFNQTLGFAQILLQMKSTDTSRVMEQAVIANQNATDALSLTNGAESQVNGFKVCTQIRNVTQIGNVYSPKIIQKYLKVWICIIVRIITLAHILIILYKHCSECSQKYDRSSVRLFYL